MVLDIHSGKTQMEMKVGHSFASMNLKNLAKLNKTKKEVESEKYFPPIGKSTKKYLFITEGFSAGSAMIPILGRNTHGFYFLKGKPMHIYGVKPVTFMANQEINELVNILGINLADPDSDMTYEEVVILSDQDPDGCDIAADTQRNFQRQGLGHHHDGEQANP